MSFVISSVLPFPPLSWWAAVVGADAIIWDMGEPFRKMSYRNRYYIAGGNGVILLSIPLAAGGRHQHTAMKDVITDPLTDWQKRHYRTLVSAYARAPYFEFYQPGLEALFETEFINLTDFSFAAFDWAKTQLRLEINERMLDINPDAPEAKDLRRNDKRLPEYQEDYPQYQQVFQDRYGFIPDLSILDILFAEGPFAARWLAENKANLQQRG